MKKESKFYSIEAYLIRRFILKKTVIKWIKSHQTKIMFDERRDIEVCGNKSWIVNCLFFLRYVLILKSNRIYAAKFWDNYELYNWYSIYIINVENGTPTKNYLVYRFN